MSQSSPGARIGWHITATLEAIGKTAEELHAALAALGVADETIYAVDLCFEELALNILQHGSKTAAVEDKPVDIEVSIERHAGGVRLILEDTAPPFDITSATANRIDKPLSTVKPGGLGVHLVNSFSSAIRYESTGTGNRVTVEFSNPHSGKDECTVTDQIASGTDDPFTAVEWNSYVAKLEVKRRAPGEILVRQGEEGDTAFFMTEGSVRIFLETHYGPVTLALRHAPCLIGEIAVFAGLPRTASAEALTPLAYYEMDRRLLLEIGTASPDLLVSVIRRMGQQIDGINQVISTYTGALAALESSDLDPEFLETLANPSPQVAEFAAAFKRFATQIVERRRQQDELSAAASLQRSFLPPKSKLAHLAGRLELDARMRPAREVGGDFHDHFMIGEGHVALVIGDICGKGMPACIFMAVVITVLRAEARRCRDVQETIARANALLCEDNAASMFATVFFGVLDLATGDLDYCNCGHNAPMIRHADGTTITLPATGLPLGLFANRQAAMARASLPPEALMFLYTDGVTEAANTAMAEYGEERLGHILSSFQNAPVAEILAEVLADVDRFAGSAEQADDITCIAIRRRA